MRKLVVLEWMSLDGIYDANYMPDYFFPYESEERGAYIRDCILECDDYLLGRVTYEMLAPYWSQLTNNQDGVADKLNSVAKTVVSTTLKTATWNNTTIVSTNVIDAITKLKQKEGNSILIAGSGTLVKSLVDAGLVDEFRLLVHPHIMGEGERFFEEGMQCGLELIKTQNLPHGVLLLHYGVPVV
jgi:dihydrofolate reductase